MVWGLRYNMGYDGVMVSGGGVGIVIGHGLLAPKRVLTRC